MCVNELCVPCVYGSLQKPKKGIGSPAAAVGGCYELPCDANQTQVLFSTEPSPLAVDVCLLPRWHLSSFCKIHLSVQRDSGFSSPSLCIRR